MAVNCHLSSVFKKLHKLWNAFQEKKSIQTFLFLSKQARSHLVNSIIKFEFLPYPPQCTMPLHSLGISRHIKTKSTVASRHQKEMTKNQRKFPSNAITIVALLQSVKRIYHTFAINLVSVVLHWFMHADSVIWCEGVSADSDYFFSFIFKKRKLLYMLLLYSILRKYCCRVSAARTFSQVLSG